jgi:hypothetical protein
VKRFDVWQYLLGAVVHEERSDSMFIRTYLVLISTKSEAIRCLTVPTWCGQPRRVKRFDAWQYLPGADIHEERSDSMMNVPSFGSRGLALLTRPLLSSIICPLKSFKLELTDKPF